MNLDDHSSHTFTSNVNNTTKDFHSKVINKHNAMQAVECVRNYPVVYEKHVTNNLEIGQVVCQEQLNYDNNINVKTNHQHLGEYMNRNNGCATKILYIGKQNTIDYALNTQEFVSQNRQQILQQDVYTVDSIQHQHRTTVNYQCQDPLAAVHHAFESREQIESVKINLCHETIDSTKVQINNSIPNSNNTIPNSNNSILNSNSFVEQSNSAVVQNISKEYFCYACAISFDKLSLLQQHKKDFHPSVKIVAKRDINDKTDSYGCDKTNTYSCTECTFVTKYSSALKRHKETHLSNRTHECPTCGKIFNQLYHLKTHKRIHTGEQVYQCPECDFITPYLYSLKRHKIYHSGEKAFECFVCEKKFSAAPDLKRHLRSHTGQKPYLCNICGRLFRQTGHLKFHKSKHHPECVDDETKSKPVIKIRVNLQNPFCSNKSEESRNIIAINQDKSKIDITKWIGDEKLVFVDKETLLHNEDDNLTSKTLTPSSNEPLNTSVNNKNHDDSDNKVVVYIKPDKTNDLKKLTFVCSICCETFKSSRDLSVHTKMHQGKKLFNCETCNFATLHSSSLRKHKRTHLSKKFVCQKCNAAFTSEERLKQHERVHDLNKKYNCDRCDFVSSYASALNRHKLIHDVDKPFSCDICDEKFTREFHLNAHKHLHSSKKVFTCDQCSFATPYHYSLKRHKISHSGVRPYPCKFCDASFAGTEDLKRHIRAHLGEKPYVCDICGQSFSQSGHVKNHKKKHFVKRVSSKAKKCSECRELFASLTLLKQHRMSHHASNKNSENALCDLNFSTDNFNNNIDG